MDADIEALQQKIEQLNRGHTDLQIALEIAIEHADIIEDELLKTNKRLQKEILRRKQLETYLKVLLDRRDREKSDLQILLDTLVEHGDAIDQLWHEKLQVLKVISQTDGLTGIANRGYFDQYLQQQWNLAFQQQDHLSIILCDIDCFKQYNDNYGHLTGDACLRRIAFALSSLMRKDSDLVARFGGEEFIILLPQADQEAAISVAERIQAVITHLSIPHSASQVCDYVTLSMGIATTTPQSYESHSTMIEIADQNLYKAKKGGRNRFVY